MKLGQLIGYDEKDHLIFFLISSYFLQLLPFENLGILNLSARSLKKYLS